MPKKQPVDNLVFKVSYWSFEDKSDRESNTRKTVFHIGGLTEDHKTVLIKATDFTPYCYLELPQEVQWTKSKSKEVFKYLQSRLKFMGPIQYEFLYKEKIHFLEKVPCLYLLFNCQGATKKCADIFANEQTIITIQKVGTF